MIPTHLIGRHIDDSDIDKPIVFGNMTCKLCGCQSDKGVTKIITDTFTDSAYFMCPGSDLLCLNCAKCLGKITTPEGKKTFFRNFSFLATETSLKLLKRENILNIILSPPEPPFVLCVTFSNKKHMSFKSSMQVDRDKYIVTTDTADIAVDVGVVKNILEVAEKWYSIVPEKANTKAQPTWFTKADILQGCSNYKKIESYGIEKYFAENKRILKYRGTGLLKLVVFCLNKAT